MKLRKCNIIIILWCTTYLYLHIYLRYNVVSTPSTTVWRVRMVATSSLIIRHNSLRDLIAEILDEVCSGVEVEPSSSTTPYRWEAWRLKLRKGYKTSLGTKCEKSLVPVKAFIDVRVFDPQARTNWEKVFPNKSIPK